MASKKSVASVATDYLLEKNIRIVYMYMIKNVLLCYKFTMFLIIITHLLFCRRGRWKSGEFVKSYEMKNATFSKGRLERRKEQFLEFNNFKSFLA